MVCYVCKNLTRVGPEVGAFLAPERSQGPPRDAIPFAVVGLRSLRRRHDPKRNSGNVPVWCNAGPQDANRTSYELSHAHMAHPCKGKGFVRRGTLDEHTAELGACSDVVLINLAEYIRHSFAWQGWSPSGVCRDKKRMVLRPRNSGGAALVHTLWACEARPIGSSPTASKGHAGVEHRGYSTQCPKGRACAWPDPWGQARPRPRDTEGPNTEDTAPKGPCTVRPRERSRRPSTYHPKGRACGWPDPWGPALYAFRRVDRQRREKREERKRRENREKREERCGSIRPWGPGQGQM